jgi:hypothetical protein
MDLLVDAAQSSFSSRLREFNASDAVAIYRIHAIQNVVLVEL